MKKNGSARAPGIFQVLQLRRFCEWTELLAASQARVVPFPWALVGPPPWAFWALPLVSCWALPMGPSPPWTGLAWPSQAWPGQARPGQAWSGQARPCQAKRGQARICQAWQCHACPGKARPGKAWHGQAKRDQSCQSLSPISVVSVCVSVCLTVCLTVCRSVGRVIVYVCRRVSVPKCQWGWLRNLFTWIRLGRARAQQTSWKATHNSCQHLTKLKRIVRRIRSFIR